MSTPRTSNLVSNPADACYHFRVLLRHILATDDCPVRRFQVCSHAPQPPVALEHCLLQACRDVMSFVQFHIALHFKVEIGFQLPTDLADMDIVSMHPL